MFNIQETVNASSSELNIETKLYSFQGGSQGGIGFPLAPNTQRDLLVMDMAGFKPDSFGLVCSKHDGLRYEDMQVRMLIYRLNPIAPASDLNFQFAYAAEPSARKGSQYVFFNTFQPSLAPGDEQNMVANWIQVSNPVRPASGQEDLVYGGVLIFYDIDGQFLKEELVAIPAGGRRDFSGHSVGSSRAGIVEFRPVDQQALFQIGNVRYVYDNPDMENSFETAFQLEGSVGKNDLLAVPLDTRNASAIIEIGNVHPEEKSLVIVKIYDESGQLLDTYNLTLNPFASHHIITDPNLAGRRGIATIEGRNIVAAAMQYARRPDASIHYMYGVSARTVGDELVLRGSYNTYLSQDSEVWIANLAKDSLVNMSINRLDGTAVLNGKQINVPRNGLSVQRVNDHEVSDNYGIVTLQGKGKVAWLLRRRGTEYVIPLRIAQE